MISKLYNAEIKCCLRLKKQKQESKVALLFKNSIKLTYMSSGIEKKKERNVEKVIIDLKN